MADSQLAQVENLVTQLGVNKNIIGSEELEAQKLQIAQKTMYAADQDIRTILDAEPLDNSGLLDSEFGKNARFANKIPKPTIADAAMSVADIAKRIVVLSDSNRMKVDVTDAKVALGKAKLVLDYLDGSRKITETLPPKFLVELCDAFEKVAMEAGIDAVLSRNYIETRGSDAAIGINLAAREGYNQVLQRA